MLLQQHFTPSQLITSTTYTIINNFEKLTLVKLSLHGYIPNFIQKNKLQSLLQQ